MRGFDNRGFHFASFPTLTPKLTLMLTLTLTLFETVTLTAGHQMAIGYHPATWQPEADDQTFESSILDLVT